MDRYIDLHTHSLISDGACNVEELIKEAHKRNVKVLSLTDHDSIAGIEKAKSEALKYNIEVINGIELSTINDDGKMVHILGLGMDISSNKFLEPYYKMKNIRQQSLKNVVSYMKSEANICIDIEELNKRKLDEFISRHDIHRYLLDNNICDNSKTIWTKYFDKVKYEVGELIPIDEAINMIKDSGGLSFLAHYNNKNTSLGYLDKVDIEKEILKLKNMGLDGVERYYPTFDSNDNEFLDYLINKYSLITSGGTDFHGSHRANNNIGISDGKFAVPNSVYSELKRALFRINEQFTLM